MKCFANLKIYNAMKIIKSVLKTLTFYLDGDDNKEVKFKGGTKSFTLHLVKT